jgi:hypothetical protein
MSERKTSKNRPRVPSVGRGQPNSSERTRPLRKRRSDAKIVPPEHLDGNGRASELKADPSRFPGTKRSALVKRTVSPKRCSVFSNSPLDGIARRERSTAGYMTDLCPRTTLAGSALTWRTSSRSKPSRGFGDGPELSQIVVLCQQLATAREDSVPANVPATAW